MRGCVLCGARTEGCPECEISAVERRGRGGPQPNAGRPHGSTTRLLAADVAAALDALRIPGESWAALARRLGVARQAIDRARREGVSERVLTNWRRLSDSLLTP